MTEILHFEILRKHGQTHKQNTDKHTHTHTHKQTDMGITIPRPPPMGGEVMRQNLYIVIYFRPWTTIAYHNVYIYTFKVRTTVGLEQTRCMAAI